MRIIVPNAKDEDIPTNNSLPSENRQSENFFEDEMKKRGFIIKKAKDDGNCLFRAIGSHFCFRF